MTGDTCYARPLKQRRRGKDRRRFVDPRYRNPEYPAFRDRRKGQRRKPEYEVCYPLLKEHPNTKWITVIGLATAFFLMAACFLINIDVSSRLVGDKKNKRASHIELPYMLHHGF
jgi:hypothetical protein